MGPLLFTIYVNDLFLFLEATAGRDYADDTAIYACGQTVENVIAKLECDALKLVSGFQTII